MKYFRTERFEKLYSRLPKEIQKKTDKALQRLDEDVLSGGLRVKKMRGFDGMFEFRIDRRYRMSGSKTNGDLILETVGMHDVGLGKK